MGEEMGRRGGKGECVCVGGWGGGGGGGGRKWEEGGRVCVGGGGRKWEGEGEGWVGVRGWGEEMGRRGEKSGEGGIRRREERGEEVR